MIKIILVNIAFFLIHSKMMAVDQTLNPLHPEMGVVGKMTTKLPDNSTLRSLRENDYRKMMLDDRHLQAAYVRLFVSSIGPTPENWQLEDHIKAAFNDLKRRRDEVSPTLIRLMNENPDTSLEAAIIYKIGSIKEINPSPFVNYARRVIQTRSQTIRSSLAEACARLLLQYGTVDDEHILRIFMIERPYLKHVVERCFSQKKMVEEKQKNNPSITDPSQVSNVANRVNTTSNNEATTTTELKEFDGKWLFISSVSIALLALLFFMRKRFM